MVAAQFGHVAAVNELVRLGAEYDDIDSEGDTAMNRAARWGQAAVVRQLVIHGANVHYPTSSDSWAPILGAAEAGEADTIVELMRGGANANDRSKV